MLYVFQFLYLDFIFHLIKWWSLKCVEVYSECVWKYVIILAWRMIFVSCFFFNMKRYPKFTLATATFSWLIIPRNMGNNVNLLIMPRKRRKTHLWRNENYEVSHVLLIWVVSSETTQNLGFIGKLHGVKRSRKSALLIKWIETHFLEIQNTCFQIPKSTYFYLIMWL